MILKCKNKNDQQHTPLFYIQTFTLGHFRSQIDEAKEEAYRLNTISEIKSIFKVNVKKLFYVHIFYVNIEIIFLLFEKSNKIVQVAIAKNWSNIGQALVDYDIKFYGLYPKNASEINCLSSCPLPLEISSLLRDEICDPNISWKHHIQPLKYF